MNKWIFFNLFALVCASFTIAKANNIPPCEQICGKWESAEKNLIVQIYMHENKYQAKIVWFSDTAGKPMDYWTDRRNPDKALRSRKILGMSILNGLTYTDKSDTWEDGMVYDSTSGKEWNASAFIDKRGQLKVRGYWHFKFIGKTMTFKRIS